MTDCFHCGLPVPPAEAHRHTVIDDISQPMCCAGCQAVSQAIVDAGLVDFYRHRTAPSPRPTDLIPDALRLYDRDDVQKSFVHRDGDLAEASLVLEGITCAACAWLNERHVGQLPGVERFQVNYATHRAMLRWYPQVTPLSDVLAAIHAIGYRAHPYDPQRTQSLFEQERQVMLRRIALAALGGMQVMMLSAALYVGDEFMADTHRELLRWACLLLTTPVLLYSAFPFFANAARDVHNRRLGMDVSVALGLAIAYVASAVHTITTVGDIYFDSVNMFALFLLTSRFLEMNARHHAGRLSEALLRLLPTSATRLRDDDTAETVAATDLRVGDRVRVLPGDPIPTDSTVIDGESGVDTSLISGESLPLLRRVGDDVIGGTLNVDSPLVLRVTAVGADTTVSALSRLLHRAQSDKPKLALLVDQLSAQFIGVVLGVALLTAVGWWWIAPAMALPVAVAVLVVTCPCALSLATPTALTAATSVLTQRGLLLTRGHALETLARVTHVILDKTGTLTHGQLQLQQLTPLHDADEAMCGAWAAALEAGSSHPLARAVAQAFPAPSVVATQLRYVAGQGVEGVVDGALCRLGTADFVGALVGQPPRDDDDTQLRIWLATTGKLLARLEFADGLREDSAATVARLQQKGIQVWLLSGDRAATVAHVAAQVGITHAVGGLSPQDKLQQVQALQQTGAVVAMVGDGVNDAPVLAAAAVSLAMGSGTQLAQAAADGIVLGERLGLVVTAIDMAQRTERIIRQNFFWALSYNAIAVPVTVAGFVQPWIAALSMSLSSLFVVVNAARLRQS